jgi:hypothetical protein
MNENSIGKEVVDAATAVLSGMKLAYLLNFGEAMMKHGITRTVNGLPE